MLSPARLLMRGSRNFCPENFKFASSGSGSIFFQVVHLLISMETYVTCCFQGDEGPDPLPSFRSAHSSSLKLSSHTYVFFTLCLTTLHGYIKSARDQSHDIWRLELGNV